jgi:16S rRNA (cytidine1402-2'-O)-methyltransferase
VAKLHIIATPIGNLEDITLRAMRVLGELGVLACEDTRHTRILFEKHGISSPKTIISYREQNEEQAGARILGFLREGVSVGICSDAGYPGISDAGYRLISRAIDAGYDVEVLPGAGAIEPALLSSGLPTSSYTFKGFPPKKPGPRRRYLEMERDLPHSLVFYESPFRLHKLLADALAVYGDRRAAVCFELTKQFERVSRGTLSELCARFADGKVRGEITVVVAGNNPKFLGDAEADDGEGGRDRDRDEADGEAEDGGADPEVDRAPDVP